MTTEIYTLLVCTIICLVLPLIYSTAYSRQVGIMGLAGNRESLPEPTGFAGRGVRAHRNLMENLLPYAIIIFAAHSLGVSNSYTVMASQAFLVARIAHAGLYLAGITVFRTISYVVGLASTIIILLQICSH